METSAPEVILVAVNGTAESLAALDWATDQATVRSKRLRIITAYDVATPATDGAGGYWNTMIDTETRTRNRIAPVVARRIANKDVQYEHIVALGSLTSVLESYCSDACLAVIGTRPRKGWRSLFNRSVTKQLIGTLSCPVVSVTINQARSLSAVPGTRSETTA